MKEVCFINKGESIEKLKKQYGYSDVNCNNNDKKFENYYIEINGGIETIAENRRILMWSLKIIEFNIKLLF